MPFTFSGRIICDPHRGSFAIRDHLQSNFGIICGLGIICGRGSFTALYIVPGRYLMLYYCFRPIDYTLLKEQNSDLRHLQ